MSQVQSTWTRDKRRMLIRDAVGIVAVGLLWLAGWLVSRMECPYDLAVWLARQGPEARNGESSVHWSHRILRRDGALVYAYGEGPIDWSDFVAFVDVRVSLHEVTSAPLREGQGLSSDDEPTVYSMSVLAEVRPYKPEFQGEADTFVAQHGVPVFRCEGPRDVPSMLRSTPSDDTPTTSFMWTVGSTQSWAVGSVGQFLWAAFPRACVVSIVSLGAVSLVVAWPRSDRAWYRRRRGKCPRCGYAGQVGVCPECGLEGTFGGSSSAQGAD